MGNMSYCRFENTLIDLEDCMDNMGDGDLSESEKGARDELITMCVDIALSYGHENGNPVQRGGGGCC